VIPLTVIEPVPVPRMPPTPNSATSVLETEKPVGKRVNVLLVPEPPGVQVFPEQVV
jgi:hypothetical protein